MDKPAKSIAGTWLQTFSKVVTVLGAATFLVGDRALREFAKFSFASAEVVGILSGVLIMGLGYVIGQAAKKVSPEQKTESK
jgi:hypothetical protein